MTQTIRFGSEKEKLYGHTNTSQSTFPRKHMTTQRKIAVETERGIVKSDFPALPSPCRNRFFDYMFFPLFFFDFRDFLIKLRFFKVNARFFEQFFNFFQIFTDPDAKQQENSIWESWKRRHNALIRRWKSHSDGLQ